MGTRERNMFMKFMEWNKRLQYVEDMILKLIVELMTKKEKMSISEDRVGWMTPEEIEWYHLENIKLDDWEMEQMRLRISALARKLATRYSLRFKRARKGSIDLGRTLRSACLETFGVPLKLKYKKKIVSKPELVVLCDVSQSVEIFSQFLLELLCVLQSSFRSMRSFLFIDTVDEVTDFFKNRRCDEAVREALEKGKYSNRPFSDYGRVFETFEKVYLPSVSRRSTLIILGDARNNYYPESGKSLERISKQVKRVIWLNPQPKEEWDEGDNIMSVFAKHCSAVFECRNLKQLAKVVEELI
ncbi:MAG: VWA domain-containing protein [Synergistetes bacterium]|nr:VWA domain-containing protein [Synergistota bacterium]